LTQSTNVGWTALPSKPGSIWLCFDIVLMPVMAKLLSIFFSLIALYLQKFPSQQHIPSYWSWGCWKVLVYFSWLLRPLTMEWVYGTLPVNVLQKNTQKSPEMYYTMHFSVFSFFDLPHWFFFLSQWMLVNTKEKYRIFSFWCYLQRL
jgi:hypothetical protein